MDRSCPSLPIGYLHTRTIAHSAAVETPTLMMCIMPKISGPFYSIRRRCHPNRNSVVPSLLCITHTFAHTKIALSIYSYITSTSSHHTAPAHTTHTALCTYLATCFIAIRLTLNNTLTITNYHVSTNITNYTRYRTH